MKTVKCTLRLSRDCQKVMQRTQQAKDAVCFPCKQEQHRRRTRERRNGKCHICKKAVRRSNGTGYDFCDEHKKDSRRVVVVPKRGRAVVHIHEPGMKE